jgi:hypothetical protein
LSATITFWCAEAGSGAKAPGLRSRRQTSRISGIDAYQFFDANQLQSDDRTGAMEGIQWKFAG